MFIFLSEYDLSFLLNDDFVRDFALVKNVAVASGLSTFSGNFPASIILSSSRSALRKSCRVQFVDLCSRAKC